MAKPKCQTFAIRLNLRIEGREPGDLEAELVIGGVALTSFDYGPVDLIQLERSMANDGVYFIWTCECGVPGCGGNHKGVLIRHRDAEVSWQDRDLGEDYLFRAEEVRASLAAAREEGHRLLGQRPEAKCVPELNREFFASLPAA